MFLATCPIRGHYWEKSRLNSPYSQPAPVSDPIFSTSPYLTDTSVLNHINSPALACSQVLLVLGTPGMGTALQKFFSSAEQFTTLNMLTVSLIKQPKTLLFSVFWVCVQNSLNKPLVFWLLLSSTCTATKFSPFPTLSSRE